MFLARVGKPSIFLPLCMGLWGIVSIVIGLTTKFVFFIRTFCLVIKLSSSFREVLLAEILIGFVRYNSLTHPTR